MRKDGLTDREMKLRSIVAILRTRLKFTYFTDRLLLLVVVIIVVVVVVVVVAVVTTQLI